MKTWNSEDLSIQAPGHTADIFNVERFPRIVELMARKLTLLNEKKTPFRAIAGCGNSGVPLLGALSVKLGIPMITVRKPGESVVAATPGQGPCTGAVHCGDYVIVDDMISSGGTVNRMMDDIYASSDGMSQCVGIMLFRGSSGTFGDGDIDAVLGHQEFEDVTWQAKKKRVPVYGVTREDYYEIMNGMRLRAAPSGDRER